MPKQVKYLFTKLPMGILDLMVEPRILWYQASIFTTCVSSDSYILQPTPRAKNLKLNK
jgi:hypothetical protein